MCQRRVGTDGLADLVADEIHRGEVESDTVFVRPSAARRRCGEAIVLANHPVAGGRNGLHPVRKPAADRGTSAAPQSRLAATGPLAIEPDG
jgi:hypothetical protein